MATTKRPLLARGERLGRNVEKPQGGGPGYLPFTIAQSEALLGPQVNQVRAEVDALPASLRGDQVYLEVTMRPNFIANSHFPRQLLTRIEASVVGTRYDLADYTGPTTTRLDEPTKTLIVAGSDSSIDEFMALINDPQTPATMSTKRNLQLIDSVRVAHVRDLPSTTQDLPTQQWDLVLHPQATPGPRQLAPASPATLEKLQVLADTYGVTIERENVTEVGGLTYVSVRATRDQIGSLLQFNPLRAAYPVIAPVAQAAPQTGAGEYDFPEPLGEDPKALRIAIFDAGLADEDSDVYHDRVTLIDHSGATTVPGAERHGMMVTSAALYGHAPIDLDHPNAVSIVHHRIWPYATAAGDPDLAWVLERISEEVREGAYDVVVLTCAPKVFVEDDVIDRWTATIDQLATETSTLFVIAAGNYQPYEVSDRVEVPGAAVNALTIGSAANHAPTRVLRTDYSRLGPGRAGGRVAPSGVSFGGTDADPFVAVDDAGAVLEDCGTSFAAPAFAGSLGSLHRLLGARSRPNMWRAFAVHFADQGRPHDGNHLGYGRLPQDYARFFDCAANEVHVMYEASIERGQTIAFNLPVPDGFNERATITWTLVYTAPVEPSNAVEYTQAGLELQCRPHCLRYGISKKGASSEHVHLEKDAARIRSLLSEGYTLSPEPETITVAPRGSTEAVLRKEGKWETIQHRSRRFQPGSLDRPRVDVTHFSRQGGILTTATAPINLVMLVTVASRSGIDVYDAVRNQYVELVAATGGPTTQTVPTGEKS